MRATLLWPSISFGLSGNRFSTVRYGGLPNQGLIADLLWRVDDQQAVIVNSRYRSEDFRYLVGIMGHEFLHHDGSNPTSEEAILNSLSAMTYVQVLIEHPELAYTRTELSRQMNDLALIFLNSRENDSPNSEVYAPTGVGVAPTSPRNEPDIWSIFNGSGTSPAPAPFGQILSNLGLPAATSFRLGTAQTFANLNDAWVSDVGRAQISVLLEDALGGRNLEQVRAEPQRGDQHAAPPALSERDELKQAGGPSSARRRCGGRSPATSPTPKARRLRGPSRARGRFARTQPCRLGSSTGVQYRTRPRRCCPWVAPES